jgi:hypothetical protein
VLELRELDGVLVTCFSTIKGDVMTKRHSTRGSNAATRKNRRVDSSNVRATKGKSPAFQADVRRRLTRLSARLVTDLRKKIFSRVRPNIARLDFELEVQNVTRGFPIHARLETVNETYKLVKIFPELRELLPEEVYASASNRDLGNYSGNVADRLIFRWFSDCWRKAGGTKLRCNSAIAFHDSTDRFNLKTRRWEDVFDNDTDDDWE